MPLFIAGVFKDRGLADRVVTALLDAGVPSADISLAVREASEEDVSFRDEWTEDETRFQDLAIHSGWERLGWQGGARPGYRDKFPPSIDMAFLAAGPIAIAIGGAQLGACSGGLVGAMSNFGFTHDTARRWYDGLVEGKAWVMVRTSEADEARARQTFDRYQPELYARSVRHW